MPFVIYADFEALTEKVHGCKPKNDNSYTDQAYQKLNIAIVVMVIKLFVVMMINTANQFTVIEMKMLQTNF